MSLVTGSQSSLLIAAGIERTSCTCFVSDDGATGVVAVVEMLEESEADALAVRLASIFLSLFSTCWRAFLLTVGLSLFSALSWEAFNFF